MHRMYDSNIVTAVCARFCLLHLMCTNYPSIEYQSRPASQPASSHGKVQVTISAAMQRNFSNPEQNLLITVTRIAVKKNHLLLAIWREFLCGCVHLFGRSVGRTNESCSVVDVNSAHTKWATKSPKHDAIDDERNHKNKEDEHKQWKMPAPKIH